MGLDAVLFDWGDTLFHFAYDEALLEAGWEAGLQATGRDDLPDHEDAAARFREGYLPLLFVPGTVEEIEYPDLIRELLAGFDIELANTEPNEREEGHHVLLIPVDHVLRAQRRAGEQRPGLLPALQSGIEVPDVGRRPQPMPVRGQRDPTAGRSQRGEGRIAQPVEVEALIGDPRRQRQRQSERRPRPNLRARERRRDPPGAAP